MELEPQEYAEDEISKEFGKSLDVEGLSPKDGYVNGHEYPLPSRHLSEWYLTTDVFPPHRRVQLPENGEFTTKHLLYGYINNNSNKVWVKIANPKSWFIDRTVSTTRGIWVQSLSALYHLKEPCTKHLAIDVKLSPKHQTDESLLEASLPSQVEMHLNLRAQVDLLWDLVDVFTESSSQGKQHHNYAYATAHAKRTPQEVHTLLSPSDEEWKSYNNENKAQQQDDDAFLAKEPFDLALLQKHPLFIKNHLVDFLPNLLGERSTFIKSLADMEPSTTEEWDPEEYMRSAMESEKRGQRTPWGDSLPNAKSIRPNLILSLRLQSSTANDNNNDSSSDEDVVVQSRRRSSAAGNRANVLSDDEEEEDEEEEEEEEVEQEEANEDSNEPQSVAARDMSQALKEFGPCLDPSPSADQQSRGDWEDVSSLKFAMNFDKITDIQSIIQKSTETTPTWSYKLLIISALKESCLLKKTRNHDKVLKKILGKPKAPYTKFEAQIILDDWREEIEKRWDEWTRKKTRDELDNYGETHVLILENMMLFIINFWLVSKPKQLKVLKDRGSDWEEIVLHTQSFARNNLGKLRGLEQPLPPSLVSASKRLNGLLRTCNTAVKHLKAIREGGAEQVTPATQEKTTPAPTAPPAELSAMFQDPTVEAKRRKDEERKKRMAAMRRTAAANAYVQESSATAAPAPARADAPSGSVTVSSTAASLSTAKAPSGSVGDSSVGAMTTRDRIRALVEKTNDGATVPPEAYAEDGALGVWPENTEDRLSWANWRTATPPANGTWGVKTSVAESDVKAKPAQSSQSASTSPHRNNQPGAGPSTTRAQPAPPRGSSEMPPLGGGGTWFGGEDPRAAYGAAAVPSASVTQEPAPPAISTPSHAGTATLPQRIEPERPDQFAQASVSNQTSLNSSRGDPRSTLGSQAKVYEQSNRAPGDYSKGELPDWKPKAAERYQQPSDYNTQQPYSNSTRNEGYPNRKRPADRNQQHDTSSYGYESSSRRSSSQYTDDTSRNSRNYEQTRSNQHQARDESRRNYEPSSKKPRRDVAYRNTPVDSGMGRGRGRDRTRPAWMSGQTSNLLGNQQEGVPGVQRHPSVPAQVPEAGQGRGRGRSSTRPAWMTAQQQQNGPTSETPRHVYPQPGNQEQGQISEDSGSWNGRGYSQSNSQTNRSRSQVSERPQAQVNHSTNFGAGRGRGIGRGKDVNKPAWMTHGNL